MCAQETEEDWLEKVLEMDDGNEEVEEKEEETGKHEGDTEE